MHKILNISPTIYVRVGREEIGIMGGVPRQEASGVR
jgi:hypothetical protein